MRIEIKNRNNHLLTISADMCISHLSVYDDRVLLHNGSHIFKKDLGLSNELKTIKQNKIDDGVLVECESDTQFLTLQSSLQLNNITVALQLIIGTSDVDIPYTEDALKYNNEVTFDIGTNEEPNNTVDNNYSTNNNEQNSLFNPLHYEENSQNNRDYFIKKITENLKILDIDTDIILILPLLAVYRDMSFSDLYNYFGHNIHYKTLEKIMTNGISTREYDEESLSDWCSYFTYNNNIDTYSIEPCDEYFHKLIEIKADKKVKYITGISSFLLEGILDEKWKDNLKTSDSSIESNIYFRTIVSSLINLDFSEEEATLLAKLHLKENGNDYIDVSIKKEKNELYSRLFEHNWITSDAATYDVILVKLTTPLYDLILDTVTEWAESIKNATNELKIIFNYLDENAGRYTLPNDSEKLNVGYSLPILTSSLRHQDDFSKSSIDDIQKLSHYIVKALKFLFKFEVFAFDETDAYVLTKLLLNGKVRKNKLYSPPYEKYAIDLSLMQLTAYGIITHISGNVPLAGPYGYYQLKMLPTKILKDKLSNDPETCADYIGKKSKTETIRLIEKYYNNGIHGPIKTRYLPEFDEVVALFTDYFTNENIPKCLVSLSLLPDSTIETIKDNAGVEKYFKLEGYLYQLKRAGFIIISGNKLSLGKPLHDILLDLFEILKQRVTEKYETLGWIFKKIEERNEKLAEKNNLTELQTNYLLSFGKSLISYEKITEEIFDIKLKNIDETIRTAIVPLVPYDNSTLIPSSSSTVPNTEPDTEIILFCYWGDIGQYVVWSTTDRADLIISLSQRIPMTLFDDIIGARECLKRTLSIDAEVLTCPNNQTRQAIRYWLEKKQEINNKWFI